MPDSTSFAFRYFSTHCWQKKHAASGTMSLRRRKICAATLKSFSAFATHSRVSSFIHDLAFFHDFTDETIAPAQPFGYVRRRPHQQVHWKIAIHCEPYA